MTRSNWPTQNELHGLLIYVFVLFLKIERWGKEGGRERGRASERARERERERERENEGMK